MVEMCRIGGGDLVEHFRSNSSPPGTVFYRFGLKPPIAALTAGNLIYLLLHLQLGEQSFLCPLGKREKTLRRAMDNRRFTRVCLGARTIEHNRKKRRETTCCGSIESNFWFIHRTGTENPFIFDSFFFICCWGSAILSINIEST